MVGVMIYGYARVSSKDQNLARQLETMKSYKNIDEVFCDKQSGKDFERKEYERLKSIVKKGDEVIIKELDRLGRNKEGVKEEIKWFKEQGVTLRILDLPTSLMDFSGQEWIRDMVNNILIEVMGAMAEQERNKIKVRQAEGIAAKKASGDWDEYGRPRKEPIDFQKFLEKQKSGEMSVAECCRELGISRATWYRYRNI